MVIVVLQHLQVGLKGEACVLPPCHSIAGPDFGALAAQVHILGLQGECHLQGGGRTGDPVAFGVVIPVDPAIIQHRHHKAQVAVHHGCKAALVMAQVVVGVVLLNLPVFLDDFVGFREGYHLVPPHPGDRGCQRYASLYPGAWRQGAVVLAEGDVTGEGPGSAQDVEMPGIEVAGDAVGIGDVQAQEGAIAGLGPEDGAALSRGFLRPPPGAGAHFPSMLLALGDNPVIIQLIRRCAAANGPVGCHLVVRPCPVVHLCFVQGDAAGKAWGSAGQFEQLRGKAAVQPFRILNVDLESALLPHPVDAGGGEAVRIPLGDCPVAVVAFIDIPGTVGDGVAFHVGEGPGSLDLLACPQAVADGLPAAFLQLGQGDLADGDHRAFNLELRRLVGMEGAGDQVLHMDAAKGFGTDFDGEVMMSLRDMAPGKAARGDVGIPFQGVPVAMDLQLPGAAA